MEATVKIKQTGNTFSILCAGCDEVLKPDLPSERAAYFWLPIGSEHQCVTAHV